MSNLTYEMLRETYRQFSHPSRPMPVNITESVHCADIVEAQVRFPRSQKRRIQKKWRKNKENWKVTVTPWTYVLQTEHGLIGHPATVRAIKAMNKANL